MKKTILSALFIFSFSLQNFASDYLKIIFKNKDSIPTSTVIDTSIQIHFKDNRLNVLFANYSIIEFEKEYPIADSFPDYMAPAVRLRLVYRIRIIESPVNNISLLKASIDSLNSPDIDTAIQTLDPITLTTPNDYYNCFACTGGNWPQAHQHLDLINALGAWEITKGLSCIKIGIVDEGFQHHTDLDNKINTTPRTAFLNPSSSNMHGTKVAGMAGAETDNNLGISSLGYNVRLQYYYWTYAGIVNAIYDGCKVVNCSWANTHSSTLLSPPPDIQEILNLAQLNNVTIVAAAGNMNFGSSTEYFFPASYDGVISVTSVGSQFNVGDPANSNWKDCHRQFTDPNDARYNFTDQHNDRVDICAPGYYLETTAANNNYGLDGGTSLAAPLVSAAAALLYSINPLFTPAQIEAYLKNYAANIYGISDNYLWSGKLGSGRLDVQASLSAALSEAYTGQYCTSCPTEATYINVTHYNEAPSYLPKVSGYFYNKDIYLGSGTTGVVLTDGNISTSVVATNSIVLIPEFNAVATANSSFSARIEPCTLPLQARAGNVLQTAFYDTTTIKILKDKKEQLKVFPNPSDNILSVIFSSNNYSSYEISIMNSFGVVIKREFGNKGEQGENKTEIDVRNFVDGLYYVVVRCGTKTYSQKFLKIRGYK